MADLFKKGYKPVEIRGNDMVIFQKGNQEEICELTEQEIKQFKHWLKKHKL